MEDKEPIPRRVGQKIKLSKDRWKLIVFVGYEATTKKRKYKSENFRGSSKQADNRLTELQHKANTRGLVLKTRTTVNQLLDEWLKTVAPASIKPATLKTYKRMARKYIRPVIGEIKLSDLDSKKVQELYTGLKNSGFAPRSIAYVHHILGASLKQAVKWKLIIDNPAADTIRPKLGRKEMRYLKPDEAVRFLEFARNGKYETVFIVAIDTGMRPEEYLGVQWGDLDSGILHVRRKLEYLDQDTWGFDTLKSARSYRSIQLAKSTVAALREHKRKQDAERLAAGPAYKFHNLIFARPNGKALSQRVIRDRFKAILKDAELDTQTRLYDLRHTSATLLLSDGVDIKTLSERLGHADEGFTLKTYAHVLPGMRARAAESLERSVFSKVGKRLATYGDNDVKAKAK